MNHTYMEKKALQAARPLLSTFPCITWHSDQKEVGMARLVTIRSLSGLGLLLAAYGLYVEHRHEHAVEGEVPFVALCDIEIIGASCR